MSSVPQHHAIQLSDFGILLRTYLPDTGACPVQYPHQDDYYYFGLIEEGYCQISIDFGTREFLQGSIVVIQPGQVHHYLSLEHLKAYALMIDSAYIDDKERRVLQEYMLNHSCISCDENALKELKLLFSILSVRMQQRIDEGNKRIIKHLSHTIVSIIVCHILTQREKKDEQRRYMEITLRFREEMKREKHLHRSVSYYAGRLHLSPAYLNEAVRITTGFSVSRNIQDEVTLRAKRMLVYTSRNIQEIAEALGFEDYAYFSRYFTKAVGVSPSLFRKKYLE